MASTDVPFPFPSCSTMCITGGTGSGKSTFVHKLLAMRASMFVEPPRSILYCYGVYQDLYDIMEREIACIKFHEGLPSVSDISELTKSGQHSIVVLDDLMSQVVNDKEAELLFTQGAHHKKMTVIFISQNFFLQGKCARTIALNTHYLVLFQNFRHSSQIVHLGKQMYRQGRWQGFVEAYEDATHRPYGYLLIDMSPHSSSESRLRTCIFPAENTLVYVVKEA